MKKLLVIFCAVAIAAGAAAGCSRSQAPEAQEAVTVVTTQSTTQAETEPETTQTTTEKKTEATTGKTTQTTTVTTTESTTKETTTKKEATTKKETTTEKKSAAGVGCKLKGVTFAPDSEMTKKMKNLADGEPEVSSSCLGKSGYDVSYTFGSTTVTCFKKSKSSTEYIYEIDMLSGKLTNGVKIGDSIKTAKSKFGVSFKDDDGIYTAKKNGVRIMMYDDGNGKLEEVVLQSTTLGK